MSATTTDTNTTPSTRKPTALMIEALQKIAAELDKSNVHYIHWPATRSLLGLEARGLVVTYDNRTGGPDPRVVLTGAGKRLLADIAAKPAPAPIDNPAPSSIQHSAVGCDKPGCLTCASKPTLNGLQRDQLHMVWTLCKANGGSTCLTSHPTALISRGYVVMTANQPRRRYALTAQGRALGADIEADREATRKNARSANIDKPADRSVAPQTIDLSDDERAMQATEAAPGEFVGPTESAPCNQHPDKLYYYRVVWTSAEGGPEFGRPQVVSYCRACAREHGFPPPTFARGVLTAADKILAVLPRGAGSADMLVTLVAPRHGMSPRTVRLVRCVDTRTDEQAWTWIAA